MPPLNVLKRYHYRWKLQLASDLVLGMDRDRSAMRRALILSDLPVAFLNTVVCPNCALEAFAVAAPGMRSEFEIVSLDHGVHTVHGRYPASRAVS